MSTIALTAKNFDDVIASNEIVLVDFWASWCAPCVSFSEVFEQVSEQHTDVLFCKVNIEEEKQLADDFGVRSVPLVMVIKKSIVVYAEAGALTQDALEQLITEARAVDVTDVQAAIDDMESGS